MRGLTITLGLPAAVGIGLKIWNATESRSAGANARSLASVISVGPSEYGWVRCSIAVIGTVRTLIRSATISELRPNSATAGARRMDRRATCGVALADGDDASTHAT